MANTTLRPGDKVVMTASALARNPRFRGVVFTVDRLLQKNIEVRHPNDPRVLRGNPTMFQLHEEGAPVGLINPDEYTVITQIFSPGEIVTADVVGNARWTYAHDQRFVVLKQNDRSVKIAKLGGENGLTWTVGPSKLTKQFD